MQVHIARTRQHRWRMWRRVLLLGVVLGIIEGLMILSLAWLQHWQFAGALFVALSLGFYLVLPAVEGFLAARQSGDVSKAVGHGCLVGGFGFLVLALAVVGVLLVIPPTIQQPSCPPGETCSIVGIGYATAFATFFDQIILVAFFVLEGLAGAICGVLGGVFGGLLGFLRQERASQVKTVL